MRGRIDRPVPARLQLADDAARGDVGEQLAQRRAERHPRRRCRPSRRRRGGRRRTRRELMAPLASSRQATRRSPCGQRRPSPVRKPKLRTAMSVRSPLRSASMRPSSCSKASGSTLLSRRSATARRATSTEALTRLAVAQLEPAAQRAVALAQLERQRHVAAQLADVGARQLGIGAAAPAAPVAALGEEGLAEAAAQAEALAPARRRRRVEANVVLAQAVADDEVDARPAPAAARRAPRRSSAACRRGSRTPAA